MGRNKGTEKYDVIQLKLTEKETQVIQGMASKNHMNVTKFVHDLIFRSGLITRDCS
jgi:tetrahydromethanopterin S-methyltransferase subunit F